ncbi:MAG: zinc-ribbon domain-containing protein [Promethearchaeota archaeon]
MIHCPACEKKVPQNVERCPYCGSLLNKLIKDPEEHGFQYLVVNPMGIPNDC